MPSWRAVLITRTAISPRFAMRILSNAGCWDGEQLRPQRLGAPCAHAAFRKCSCSAAHATLERASAVGRAPDAAVRCKRVPQHRLATARSLSQAHDHVAARARTRTLSLTLVDSARRMASLLLDTIERREGENIRNTQNRKVTSRKGHNNTQSLCGMECDRQMACFLSKKLARSSLSLFNSH